MDILRNLQPWRAWLTGLWLCVFITTGSALSCYICNSTLDSSCQEKFNPDSEVAQDNYKECFMWNAKYCIKVTGLWGGIVGAHRFCSSRDLGDQCQDMWFPDHDRMYRACVYTCTGDGCNSATSLTSTTTVIITSTFGVLAAIIRTVL